MEQLDTSTLGGWLRAIWLMVSGVLRLQEETYRTAVAHPDGLRVALIVLFLAGLSVAAGQSVVLFANGVPRRRFLLTMIGSAVVSGISVIGWAVSAWLGARLLFGLDESLRTFLILVCMGTAPAIFGFFLLFPYLGVLLGWGLRIWIYVAVLVGIGTVLMLDFWPAVLICLVGWVLFELLIRLPIFDVGRLSEWIWRATTGRDQRIDPDTLASQLAQQASKLLAADPDQRAAHDDEQEAGA